MSGDRPIALRLPIILVLSMVCLAAPAWADFKAGENAYHRGDYATALREWQPLAKQRHAVAQYNLGLLYANGQGVTKDNAQARQWYEKAATQGHADAQVNLGILLVYARGVLFEPGTVSFAQTVPHLLSRLWDTHQHPCRNGRGGLGLSLAGG